MNKIYLDILSKSGILAEGISKNAKELASKNIHINTDKILSMRKELESAAKEQEVAEKHLAEARKKAHKAMDELKQYCLQAKQPIKHNFFVDSWARFGLTDKR